jgi:excisionase family DNA binding protein
MSALLSTGQAARLCAVTPDTVLKWVRSGRLRAHRTAGGHCRIARRDLESLNLVPAANESTPNAAPLSSRRPNRHFEYCWEYNSRDGNPLPGCQECLVFQARAERCYEIVKRAGGVGHQRIFCRGACEDCDYYRRVQSQRTNVLVVSDNQVLTALLRRESTAAPFNLEITDCEYACSALVDSFRPDFAVVDCSLGPQRSQDICAHLLQDPRIPFARIILAARPQEFPTECDRAIFARIARPFGIEDIAACLEGIASQRSLQGGGDPHDDAPTGGAPQHAQGQPRVDEVCPAQPQTGARSSLRRQSTGR